MIDKFKEIYRRTILREGADQLLKWLETTDFFTAPASTRHHLCYEGGFVEHSINVYTRFRKLYASEVNRELIPIEEETIAICGLLHDVCKANYYGVEMRNRKNDKGVWEKYPYYVVADKYPYGHGEKSVRLIEKYMKLSEEEAFAIRWHMGGFDESVKGGSYSEGKAYEMFPIAVLMHLADMMATYLDEVDR